MNSFDERWRTLGRSLVNYSLNVQPGEKVMIMMLELTSYPLAREVYTEVIRAGGFAQIQLMTEELKHKILQWGNPDQISWVPEIEAYGMEWADCYIALRGGFNLAECEDISPQDVATYQKAMGKISTLRWQKTRWALVRVPNAAFAQQAGVSEEKMMDMFFSASTLDWPLYVQENQRIADRLERGKRMRICARDTNLSFSFQGPWTVMDNTQNIPDGETFVTPVWDSVQGHIRFEFPATLGGRVIHDLDLTFQDGHVVDIQAATNLDFVKMIIHGNENADRVGEIAFGTNPFVTFPTTDILIDEKMAGTMHLALGRPYDGSYSSPIHWDIVKDTRTEAEVYLDDHLIFRDGKFLEGDWS